MQITGGKVTFGRSVQPAQYETKKAEVEITFTLSEGEALGATLDIAASLAQSKALEMVGLKSAPALAQEERPGQTSGTKEAAAAALNAKDGATTTTEKKKPGRPPATPKPEKTQAPDPAALDDDAGHAAKIAENTVVNGEPRQISQDPENRQEPADELSDMLGDAPKPVTDENLTSEIMTHNGKIKNPTAIRGLIMKFCGGKSPCQARDIPQEKRAEFLVDLKKL